MSTEQQRIEREWFKLAGKRDECRLTAQRQRLAGDRNGAILTMRNWAKIGKCCKALEEEYRALLAAETTAVPQTTRFSEHRS